MKTIDLTPTWKTAATIYATTLKDGTDKGKQMAFEEVQKMGELIDNLQAELKRIKDTTPTDFGDNDGAWNE